MCGEAPRAVWHAFGATATGPTHARDGRPNQDSLKWMEGPRNGLPIVMALSDGHGGSRHVRSDTGSAFAVDVAHSVMSDLAAAARESRGGRSLALSEIRHMLEYEVPKRICLDWDAMVDRHISLIQPFTQSELERAGCPPRPARDAYGATLLTVAVVDGCLLCLQLGDGDILVVMDDGEVFRPFPKDASRVGNETDSLCVKDAWKAVRTHFAALPVNPPVLVLAATDGYSNSFISEGDFEKVGKDMLAMLRERGTSYVKASLASWLAGAASVSGDDVTAGVVCRTDGP